LCDFFTNSSDDPVRIYFFELWILKSNSKSKKFFGNHYN
jgi:hypothetical protein